MLNFHFCTRRFGISSLMYLFEESIIERYQRLQQKPEDTFGLPWTFKGESEKPANFRYACDQMIIRNEISVPKLVTGFYHDFEKVLKAIGNNALNEVEDLLNPSLYKHLERTLGTLKQSGKRVELHKTKDFPDESGRPTVNVIDAVLYRGLSVNRAENPPLESFHVASDVDLGIFCYTHKDLSDRFAYVNQARMEELHAKNRMTIIQCLAWIKSPWMLKVFDDKGEVSQYPSDYSYVQQWIFESQCVQPPWMKREDKLESYLEWMTKFKPDKWAISGMNDYFDPLTKYSEDFTKSSSNPNYQE
ncbi:unnamed protein product [Blepharisma stoltei]|uniref:Uncharacterized protein n=1 Tax=Blepharisma stoltei TaxID=1481888 RepID=A0AAU9ILC1_9CILI|nr:unnamed protein product [Blepharisma stoltei]